MSSPGLEPVLEVGSPPIQFEFLGSYEGYDPVPGPCQEEISFLCTRLEDDSSIFAFPYRLIQEELRTPFQGFVGSFVTPSDLIGLPEFRILTPTEGPIFGDGLTKRIRYLNPTRRWKVSLLVQGEVDWASFNHRTAVSLQWDRILSEIKKPWKKSEDTVEASPWVALKGTGLDPSDTFVQGGAKVFAREGTTEVFSLVSLGRSLGRAEPPEKRPLLQDELTARCLQVGDRSSPPETLFSMAASDRCPEGDLSRVPTEEEEGEVANFVEITASAQGSFWQDSSWHLSIGCLASLPDFNHWNVGMFGSLALFSIFPD